MFYLRWLIFGWVALPPVVHNPCATITSSVDLPNWKRLTASWRIRCSCNTPSEDLKTWKCENSLCGYICDLIDSVAGKSWEYVIIHCPWCYAAPFHMNNCCTVLVMVPSKSGEYIIMNCPPCTWLQICIIQLSELRSCSLSIRSLLSSRTLELWNEEWGRSSLAIGNKKRRFGKRNAAWKIKENKENDRSCGQDKNPLEWESIQEDKPLAALPYL
jgi:hypothetical protein